MKNPVRVLKLLSASLASSVVCLLLSLTAQAHEPQSPPPLQQEICHQFFENRDFPLGWSLAPNEAREIARTLPFRAPTLANMAQWAEFIQNAPDEFFDELGRIIYLAPSPYMFGVHYPEGTGDAEEYSARILQGRFILQLIKDPLAQEFVARHFAEAHHVVTFLKPLPLETDFDLRFQLMSPEMRIGHYIAKKASDLPSTRALYEQFRSVRQRIVEMAASEMRFPIRHPRELQIIAELHIKEMTINGEELKSFAPLFRKLDAVLKGEVDSLSQTTPFNRKTPKALFAKYLLVAELNSLVASFTTTRPNKAPEFITGLQESPLHSYLAWTDFLASETLIDRDADSALRSFFVEAILQKSVMRGPAVRQLLRDYLINEGIKPVRSEYRDTLKRTKEPSAPAPHKAVQTNPVAKPSRDQRIAEYLEQKALKPNMIARLASAPQSFAPANDSEVQADIDEGDLTFARILEGKVPLSEVPANTPIPIKLERTKLIYRVSFSQELLDEWQNPSQPQLTKEWLKALSLGPARQKGENGWKKLTIPVAGIYNWEIKIADSPWRIYGFRDGQGVWHFEKIARDKTHK